MTPAEMENYRQQLLVLRQRLNGDVSQLEDEALRKAGGAASGNLSNVPLHLADLGTDNYEEEITLDLLGSEESLLEEIGGAIQRIHDGTFGRCVECQREIGKERLRALPYTRFCIDCARKTEAGPTP